MKVTEVICAAGRSGYMHRDLTAIKSGTATPDGSLYRGKPMSAGFTRIIEPATIISVILKRVELLPHASFQIVSEHVGLQGEKLAAFVRRVAGRIKEIGDEALMIQTNEMARTLATSRHGTGSEPS
jgi:methylaspartate ammonia-lyase